MNDIRLDPVTPVAPVLPMATYWVVPALDPSGAFQCFYYDKTWTMILTGALDCDEPGYDTTNFLCLVACGTPSLSVIPLPQGFFPAAQFHLVGAVAQTHGLKNYLQPFFGAIPLPDAGSPLWSGVVLPVIPKTGRAVILVFAEKDGLGNVLRLVASRDPEIKNGTGPGVGGD